MKSVLCLRLCSLLLVAACSAGAPGASVPDTPSTAEDGPPKNETERERTIRLAKEKRAQCDTLADTIQGEPEIDVIANINDGAALETVAAKLDKSAVFLGSLSVADAALAELLEAYVDILQGKAAALRAVAATQDDSEKKQHLRAFQQQLEAVGGTIEGINQACSSAPGIVAEPSEETSVK